MNPARNIKNALKVAACVLPLAGCFYGHPVSGVASASEADADAEASSLDLIALTAIAPAGSAQAEETTDDPVTPVTPVTPTEQPIYLFLSTATAGDLRNGQPTARAGADLRCASSAPAFPTTCTEIRAFISLTATDEIQDMPANYNVPIDQPIYPPGGSSLRLAPNWTDLLDPAVDLERSLAAAALGAAGGSWMSFSLAGGTLSPANCVNGTSTVFTNSPGLGDTSRVNQEWLQATFGSFCSASLQMLCICYTP